MFTLLHISFRFLGVINSVVFDYAFVLQTDLFPLFTIPIYHLTRPPVPISLRQSQVPPMFKIQSPSLRGATSCVCLISPPAI